MSKMLYISLFNRWMQLVSRFKNTVLKVQTCACVCARVCAPVFFGIFKVLLVVSGLQEVALNDPDDPDS